MAQVLMPAQKPLPEDNLTKLMKGLTIASQVYGIRTNMAQLDELNRRNEDANNLDQGKYSKSQQLSLSDKFNITPDKPAQGQYQEITDAKSGSPLYVTVRKDTSPLIQKIETIKNGVPTTILYDARNNKEINSFESPKEVKTREIKTIDPATGNEVTQIVPDKAGQSFTGAPKDKLSKPTSQTAQEVGSFDAALNMVDGLGQKYNSLASEPMSGLKSLLPGSNANLYDQDRKLAAQNIGVILEKGKLTDKDYERYYNMLPGPFDPNPVAQAKLDAMNKYIAEKKVGEIGGLKQSGFETKGFKSPQPANVSISPKKDTSGEAQGAPAESDAVLEQIKIRANGGDKKAQDYLKSLGGQ